MKPSIFGQMCPQVSLPVWVIEIARSFDIHIPALSRHQKFAESNATDRFQEVAQQDDIRIDIT
jgi:hypothetical protein